MAPPWREEDQQLRIRGLDENTSPCNLAKLSTSKFLFPQYLRPLNFWACADRLSLLRRLQAQHLPDEAPPIGKIHPFSKMAVTFEPVMRFGCPSRFRISSQIVTWSLLWLKAPFATVRAWRRRKDIFPNHYWMNKSQRCLWNSPWLRPGLLNINTKKDLS